LGNQSALPGQCTDHRGFRPGNGHGLLGEVQPGRTVGRCYGYHAIARVGRAAALANDQSQGLRQLLPNFGQYASNAIRIGIVDEMDRHLIGARLRST
jgi:hypothetical protein